MYSGYTSLIRYRICKYFLQVYGLSFHFLNSVFSGAKVFDFDEIQFIIIFFYGSCFWYYIRNSLPNPRS